GGGDEPRRRPQPDPFRALVGSEGAAYGVDGSTLGLGIDVIEEEPRGAGALPEVDGVGGVLTQANRLGDLTDVDVVEACLCQQLTDPVRVPEPPAAGRPSASRIAGPNH